jgi:hypothetical protein
MAVHDPVIGPSSTTRDGMASIFNVLAVLVSGMPDKLGNALESIFHNTVRSVISLLTTQSSLEGYIWAVERERFGWVKWCQPW